MRVTPLTSLAVKRLPREGGTDCNLPWFQDRLACLRLYSNGAAVNIGQVELQIFSHSLHSLFFLSFAVAWPLEGNGIAAGYDSTPETSEGSYVIQVGQVLVAVFLITQRLGSSPFFLSFLSSAHQASTSGAAASAMTTAAR